jgi:hypothetical protein
LEWRRDGFAIPPPLKAGEIISWEPPKPIYLNPLVCKSTGVYDVNFYGTASVFLLRKTRPIAQPCRIFSQMREVTFRAIAYLEK